MKRFYYSNTFARFSQQSTDEILGTMARNSEFDDVQEQKHSKPYQQIEKMAVFSDLSAVKKEARKYLKKCEIP